MKHISGFLLTSFTLAFVVGCGNEAVGPAGGAEMAPSTSATTPSAAPSDAAPSDAVPSDVVPLPPPVNWDAPVLDGIDATEETAQALAQVDFAIDVPALAGELIRIQSTDPGVYPEDMRGYGVLFDMSAVLGAPDGIRLMIEETRATPDDPQFIRNIAVTGDGYSLELVESVEVVFIHPAEKASAVFVYNGVKYNVYGRDLPLAMVRDAVETIIESG